MQQLEELREDLAGIDSQIAELYKKRVAVCEKIGDIKIDAGQKVFDKKREKEQLSRITKGIDDEFMKLGLTELFEQLMSQSRKMQYQMLTKRCPWASSLYWSRQTGLGTVKDRFPGNRRSLFPGCYACLFWKECQ